MIRRHNFAKRWKLFPSLLIDCTNGLWNSPWPYFCFNPPFEILHMQCRQDFEMPPLNWKELLVLPSSWQRCIERSFEPTFVIGTLETIVGSRCACFGEADLIVVCHLQHPFSESFPFWIYSIYLTYYFWDAQVYRERVLGMLLFSVARQSHECEKDWVSFLLQTSVWNSSIFQSFSMMLSRWLCARYAWRAPFTCIWTLPLTVGSVTSRSRFSID